VTQINNSGRITLLSGRARYRHILLGFTADSEAGTYRPARFRNEPIKIERPMQHRYDPVADAVYIYLTGEIGARKAMKSKVADLEFNGGHIAYDFDNEGRILGIDRWRLSNSHSAGIALLQQRSGSFLTLDWVARSRNSA